MLAACRQSRGAAREHGTRIIEFGRALELLRIRDWLWHRREDRVRRDRMEAAGALYFGRSNRFVMRAEIDGSVADSTRQTYDVHTLATDSPSKTFVTA